MSEQDSMTAVDNKDGTYTVTTPEGEVKTVKESDLLAIKGSKEGLELKVTELVTGHMTEVEGVKTQLSDAQQAQYAAEAKVKELEVKVAEGAGSSEELARVKQELEQAQRTAEEAVNQSLESRRQLISGTYGIPIETVKDKTKEQLDAYEEALKTVSTAKGAGNLAIGGGGGGAVAAEKPLDRAARILAEHDARRGSVGGGGSSFKAPEKD